MTLDQMQSEELCEPPVSMVSQSIRTLLIKIFDWLTSG